MVKWLGGSLLLGSLAVTGCASIYDVGELTAGADEYGGAGEGGAPATPSAGGAKAGAGTNGGATFTVGSGGTTVNLGNGGNGGAAAVSGVDNNGSLAGLPDQGDDQELPPSCAALPDVCGSSESASRNCCASLEVAGGTFFRSYDGLPGAGADDPSAPASISTFRLDAYEVTVGRFRRFVDAYPWRPAAGAGRNSANEQDFGWNSAWVASLPRDAVALSSALANCGSANSAQPSMSTWTVTADVNETLPINCLTWFEAFAFCAWDGGRLPSEAEWNYAAAGGTHAWVYPWESSLTTDIDSNFAVYQSSTPAKVGSKPRGDGLFGQADMAGNVWEWNADWARETYSVPCDDCAELAADVATSDRVLRGGAHYNEPPYLRTAMRGNAPPSIRDSGYGVRCARDGAR
ncbi:MAG TPA: SUMF1/EgtB/PvdO family nonheme iron enzyme [Polyangiaceae bacterium]|nr:SUMF1/EgtB/PvdO family nonheme iron enzyme [Polyangiaceae bacterium]